MTTTFYGVLGVESDADADAIRRGFRERVRDVHPDVNDDPDADSQFRRLTTAKETLLDESERARYDRLGHASYVRHHVTGSAWTVDDAGTCSSETDTAHSSTPDAPSSTPDDPQSSAKDETEPSTAGTGEPSGAGDDDRDSATAARSASNASDPNHGRTSSRSDPDSSARENARRRRRETSGRRDTGSRSSGSTYGRRAGRSGYGGVTDDAAAPGAGTTTTPRSEEDETWWTDRDPDESGTSDSGSNRSVSESYTTSSFWDSQRVGERYSADTPAVDPPLVRLLNGVRSLGPWVIVHAVFLAIAIGTSWYVYAVVLADMATPLPLLLVLVGAVLLAGLLSTVHVISRIYR